ncbi:rhodanese-like domain-containing protein [Amycolatopsis anabasis]|uniref:rhodanese-like domain-containing protein n=1 Tax=Amycolatopsis anabasis TaxID=1840409 RepID=UPI00131DAA2A|nr:rhodanese-like domain-containing protein [Amycolatopsis anabasis]
MTNPSRVLAQPAATPPAAAAYFAAELAFDVDPDDLVRDLLGGNQQGYLVVETRAPEAFAAVRIPGAINLPYREMTRETTARLDRELVYVCYCESFQCNAATKGALNLAKLGFQVKRLAGGITAWQLAGYPVEGERAADPAPAIGCAC